MRCPGCRSEDCQRVEMAYAEALRTTAFEADLGPVQTGVVSAGTARLQGRTLPDSARAAELAPPEPLPPTRPVGLLTTSLCVAVIMVFGSGLLAVFAGCFHRDALPGGLLLLALGAVGCAVVRPLIPAKQEDPDNAAALAAWRRMWLCHRCGDVWEGPDPRHGPA